MGSQGTGTLVGAWYISLPLGTGYVQLRISIEDVAPCFLEDNTKLEV